MPSTLPSFNDVQDYTGTLTYVESTTAASEAGGWFYKATITALRAVGTNADNKVAVVEDIGGWGAGMFRWDSTSTDADNGTTIIAPDDGGTGRWVRVV